MELFLESRRHQRFGIFILHCVRTFDNWCHTDFSLEAQRKKGLTSDWREDSIVATKTFLIVASVLYGPVLIWSVCATVYTDHLKLVSQNQSLAQENNNQKIQLHQDITKISGLADQVAALTVQEPEDSLRRRTFKLADEFTSFLIERQKTKPPDAIPNSADPNPSEERRTEIEKSQIYYRRIEEYYFKNFKDRFIGILIEYDSHGVKTGYLKSDFAQRVPYLPSPGSIMEGMDELSLFRDLAYHVDARDHLIVFQITRRPYLSPGAAPQI